MRARSLLRLVAAAGVLSAAVNMALGQDWIQISAAGGWYALASSSDGCRLIAATSSGQPSVSFGLIYTSTNAAATWTQTSAPNCAWASVACSANGGRLAAVPLAGPIYTSADGGTNWIASTVSNSWVSVASSADGAKLVAASGGGWPFYSPGIWTSTNSGGTWTESTPPGASFWTCVASSADGSRLVATSFGAVYCSTNGGANWTQSTAPNLSWGAVACSADGRKLLAAWCGGGVTVVGGGFFVSSDSGATWTPLTNPSYAFIQKEFGGVASSADGNAIAAILPAYPTQVYVTTHSNQSWALTVIPCGDSNRTNYCRVASSADGCRLVASVGSGCNATYTWHTTPQPALGVAPSVTNLSLCWIIPSQPFVLQVSGDLNAANWTDVTNVPLLNLTNLQNQVVLPLPGSNSFYRLKSSVNGT